MKHTKSLAAHAARIEGQLAAVRKALMTEDCSKAAQTLAAASRSLASLRAACAEEFIRGRVYQNAHLHDVKLMKDVRTLMHA